jgi:hypothetical protein
VSDLLRLHRVRFFEIDLPWGRISSMLRFIVLALMLVNGAYFAWSQGLLWAYGWGPATPSEPHHHAQQILPEAVRILTEQEARALEIPSRVASKPPVCLQAGLFDDDQSTVLHRALESALPAGGWALDAAVEPARWIVYMGKYVNAEALAKKRGELAALKLKVELLTNPALELGLSLGSFETQAQAAAALDALSRRGVRTAKVMQERAERKGLILKIPAVDDAVRGHLEEIKPALAGKILIPCH